MTSSDRRREVAERLREYSNDVLKNGSLLKTLKDVTGAYSWRDVLDRLADLIDPTCHIAPDDWASQQCMGPMLSCDRCQAAFPEINSPYVYCPNCGARVVEG